MAAHRNGGVALIASFALAACGGGASPGGGSAETSATAPPIVTKTYSFPQGDASASAGTTAWDITGVTTTLSGQFGNAGGDAYDTLRVDVTFAQNVSNALPAPGQALSSSGNELGVGIALDTDANPNTGTIYSCATTASQTPFEYLTDQGNDPSRLIDGNYSILFDGGPIANGGNNPPSEAMTTAGGNTVSETLFLSAIGVHGGRAIPKIGVSVAASNGIDMNALGIGGTDCVPKLPAVEFFTS